MGLNMFWLKKVLCGNSRKRVRILLDFLVFDTKKLDEYAKQAKAFYGQLKEYKEFVEKSKKLDRGRCFRYSNGIYGDFY